MIQILDSSVTNKTRKQEWLLDYDQLRIIECLARSPDVYTYPSLEQLKFEGKLRSHIVSSAKKLYRSGTEFAVFKDSRCNPRYWTLTDKGGFRLNEDVKPSEGIRDIFINGHMYAFECATAVVIVYYKGVLESIGSENFNRLFPSILLFDGVYDEKLGITWSKHVEYLPGDIQYFKNPEYNPKTPEWQGENVVLLENYLYFAYGIGITTKKQVIAHLNKERIPGATTSAYLIDEAARPDFAYLSQYDQSERDPLAGRTASERSFTIAHIGTTLFVCR